jgi:hypothetical protein
VADAIQFRSSVAWSLTFCVLLTVGSSIGVQALIWWLSGGHVDWVLAAGTVASLTIVVLITGGVTASQLRRRPTWIWVSSIGIEMVFRGGDPVLLAWSEIDAARVRRRGPFAVVNVVPADLYLVRCVLPSRDLPPIRNTAAGAAFTIDVGLLRPGPDALRGALARHSNQIQH